MFKSPILVIFLLFFSLVANSQTFKAGAFVGLTASQINGDDSAGYNKPGLEGGLKVLVNLKEKTDLSLELQYSQRGAKEESNLNNTPQATYQTDYIAVPIIYSYKDWIAEEYFRLHFHGGLSFGRLVRSELKNDIDNTDFLSCWRKNDFSILVGATYFLNENFGITVRYNRSLRLLYNNNQVFDPMENPCNSINTNSLAPHNLSFLALYLF